MKFERWLNLHRLLQKFKLIHIKLTSKVGRVCLRIKRRQTCDQCLHHSHGVRILLCLFGAAIAETPIPYDDPAAIQAAYPGK